MGLEPYYENVAPTDAEKFKFWFAGPIVFCLVYLPFGLPLDVLQAVLLGPYLLYVKEYKTFGKVSLWMGGVRQQLALPPLTSNVATIHHHPQPLTTLFLNLPLSDAMVPAMLKADADVLNHEGRTQQKIVQALIALFTMAIPSFIVDILVVLSSADSDLFWYYASLAAAAVQLSVACYSALGRVIEYEEEATNYSSLNR